MKTLYEELNVKEDFTADELKSKFRKLSKKYHPDKKGNSDTFIRLKKAYDILKDPIKRKFYDETGNIPDEMEGNKLKTKAKENLFNLIKSVIYNPNIIEHYENMNLITIINKAINDNKNIIELNIKKISKEYKTAKKILLRLKHKKETDDFMKEMIENTIKEREGVIKNMSNDIKMFDMMLKIVEEYEYNFDEVIKHQSIFTNVNSQTSTMTYTGGTV